MHDKSGDPLSYSYNNYVFLFLFCSIRVRISYCFLRKKEQVQENQKDEQLPCLAVDSRYSMMLQRELHEASSCGSPERRRSTITPPPSSTMFQAGTRVPSTVFQAGTRVPSTVFQAEVSTGAISSRRSSASGSRIESYLSSTMVMEVRRQKSQRSLSLCEGTRDLDDGDRPQSPYPP